MATKQQKPEQDWQALEFRVRTLFTPAAPIGEAELFAGRRTQIQRLFNAIAETGRHAVLFGERGVGKTSLANVFHELVSTGEDNPLLPIKKQAGPRDTFTALWRKVFRDMNFEIKRKGDYGNDRVEAGSLADLYPNEITPDDVIREVRRFSESGHPVIIFDEFDKLEETETKKLMSHTIKALSDTGIRATIILVGVADDINTLVAEHQSVTRNIAEIKMPRMSKEELNVILNSRYQIVGMKIEGDARWKIVTLSRGLPEFVHALGRGAALHAISNRRIAINERDVDIAINETLDQSDQSANAAYKLAIDSNKKNALYRQVLVACAITKSDDEGKFAAKDVVEPLTGILGKKVEIAGFQSHLAAFCTEERGFVLERHGKERAYKYRFREPKMQPYVIMQGIAKGDVGREALATLSAPEQPRLSNEF